MRTIVALVAALFMGCASTGPQTDAAAAPRADGSVEPDRPTAVFECDAPDGDRFGFTIRFEAEKAALWLPRRFDRPYLALAPTRAASGARYEADGVIVWTEGNEARLEVGEETFAGCTRDPWRSVWEKAKLDGIDFRAVGNEPGWHLEIRNSESIRFVYAYGESEVTVPAPEPAEDDAARRTTYRSRTAEHDLTVVLEGRECTDTMRGDRFETTVTVSLGDETFRGCGRALH